MLLRTIGVRFPSNKQTYHYFVPAGDDPEVGDMVVTSVSYEAQTFNAPSTPWTPAVNADPLEGWLMPTAKMALVVEISGDQHPKANKFYVALIGAKALAARQVADAAQLKTVQIQRDARKELDALLAAEDKRQAYLRLAESNPRAQELLRTIGELPPAVTARPKSTREMGVEAGELPADLDPTPPKGSTKRPGVTAYNGNTDVDPQEVAPSPAPVASPFARSKRPFD